MISWIYFWVGWFFGDWIWKGGFYIFFWFVWGINSVDSSIFVSGGIGSNVVIIFGGLGLVVLLVYYFDLRGVVVFIFLGVVVVFLFFVWVVGGVVELVVMLGVFFSLKKIR